MSETTLTPKAPTAPRYKIGYQAGEWGEISLTPDGIPDPAGDWVRYDDHAAALASAAQPAPIREDTIAELHARVQKLERELSSIGAGGVEPLRRRHDPDIARLTERGAVAWAGVDAQALRDGDDIRARGAQGESDV